MQWCVQYKWQELNLPFTVCSGVLICILRKTALWIWAKKKGTTTSSAIKHQFSLLKPNRTPDPADINTPLPSSLPVVKYNHPLFQKLLLNANTVHQESSGVFSQVLSNLQQVNAIKSLQLHNRQQLIKSRDLHNWYRSLKSTRRDTNQWTLLVFLSLTYRNKFNILLSRFNFSSTNHAISQQTLTLLLF